MSAIGLRLLFAALLASAAIAQTTVDNVCGETFMVGDLVFTLPSSGSVAPSLLYWNVADLATQFQLSLSNITAFNASDDLFDFANTTFSSWTWNWDCSLSCTNVSNAGIPFGNVTFGGLANSSLSPLNSNNTNITSASSDMCFYIFNGSNGQTGNLSMTISIITNAFVEQNGTGVLAFSVRLSGPLVTSMLQQADIFLLDLNYSCFGSGNLSNCSAVRLIQDTRADINGNQSQSVFTLVNHTVSFIGPNVAPCSLIAASNGNNSCGLNGFNLTVEDNVTVVSFEWNSTQVNGFDTILLDSRAYTLALNTSGPVVPTPTPTPPESPLVPSFSRCYCNITTEPLLDATLNMSNLWDDHILYTRLAVEEMIFNSTSISNDTITRLYQNADDLGDNFGIFYCQDNGKQYAQLIRRQVNDILANVTAIMNNQNQTNVTDRALEFANYWNAVNPFAVTDEVYNLTSISFSALSNLMNALNDQDSSAVVTQQDAFSQATRNMVTYLLQAFKFQRLLRCTNNCGSI
jgi:hypothetical protein